MQVLTIFQINSHGIVYYGRILLLNKVVLCESLDMQDEVGW